MKALIDLSDRVAVVTGGGRGIGAAICDALAATGARVAVWDLDGDTAKRTADALIADYGTSSAAVQVDVTDADSIDAAVEQTERELGPVEVLVNNAGTDIFEPFLQSTPKAWDHVIAVNLLGTVACCHRVLPGMVERGYGRIVNIGSDAGRVGSSGEAVYSATKGGVIAFTKTVAREMASRGVTVNCVCPGPTDTVLFGQLGEANPKLYDALSRAIPLRRIGQPADIAPAVAFLASDAAGFVTGQTLSVSGGLTMS